MNRVDNIKKLKINIEIDDEGIVKQKIILDYGKRTQLKKITNRKSGFINEFPHIRDYLERKADCLEACLFVRQKEDEHRWKYL